MADGYDVSPDLLQEASSGINQTIGELKTLGISEAAEQGDGFGALALTGMQTGNDALTSAFSSFASKWAWGVRTMVQEGNQIARLLGLSAGAYNDAEQYATGVLKDAVNSVAGDPHAGEQQVESTSFGQLLSADKPDYSATSWQQTSQHASTTWTGVAQDAQNTLLGPAPGSNTR